MPSRKVLFAVVLSLAAILGSPAFAEDKAKSEEGKPQQSKAAAAPAKKGKPLTEADVLRPFKKFKALAGATCSISCSNGNGGIACPEGQACSCSCPGNYPSCSCSK